MLVALLLSALVGLSLGLLGGGGSILMVPTLVHAVGLGPREAIATSLLVVGLVAAAALVSHARAGQVAWRTGMRFGGAGMVGSELAGLVAQRVPTTWLTWAFIALMSLTALAMLRPAPPLVAKPRAGRRSSGRMVAVGAGVGALTGLVGAGGGFVVVPALVLFGGLPMREAIGTSLLVIALQSLAGFATHAAHVAPAPGLTAAVVAAAMVGALAGSHLTGRVPAARLRRGFAFFVLALAAWMAAGALPAGWREVLAHGAWPRWLLGVLVGAALAVTLRGGGRWSGASGQAVVGYAAADEGAPQRLRRLARRAGDPRASTLG